MTPSLTTPTDQEAQHNRLAFASTGLVAVGVISLVRFLLAGRNRR